MADDKQVWVKATMRGQMPNGGWVDESSPPFQVEESKISKRWMEPLSAQKAKGLVKAIRETADDEDESLADVQKERDELRDKVEQLEGDLKTAVDAAKADAAADLKAAQADLEKAKADLESVKAASDNKKKPPSVAGEKKD